MTVSRLGWSDEPQPLADVLPYVGEILEKVTRVLTPEEQALLDQDWVGKNGTKRRMEVNQRCSHVVASAADPWLYR